MSVTEALIQEIDVTFSSVKACGIGVAVSGGGDSVALLRAISEWNTNKHHKIYVATVHHNLRPEAQAEADFVAKLCGSLDIPHQTLYWEDWNGTGNLQNAARNARRALLRQWSQTLGLSGVALGHTKDDQVETFLMHLARGSGVDGLAAMQPVSGCNPVWLRPFLRISRKKLRRYLVELGQSWMEDPTNNNEKFDRIKIRKALPILSDLGLTLDRIVQTAEHMQNAKTALECSAQRAAKLYCVPDKYGTVKIDLAKLQAEPKDIQYRLMCYAISWVSGALYRPRFSALKRTFEALKCGHPQTLGGCYMKPIPLDHLIVMREQAAMIPVPLESGIFDHRWEVTSSVRYKGATITPLGEEGLTHIKNWRDLSVSRDVLLQMPAVWQNNTIIAAPLIDFGADVSISLTTDLNGFYKNIVSH